ncbi:cell division protein FtsB [Xanthomonas sacchari]|uniref:Cell division protein FtsB n=1 Tax=Xanthomonas sacchari TaxID=56458 RepID=A0A2P5Z2D9_9XANT|nr:cell division protein FtsB [Xanthomonas sacchari]MCC4590985.1 cell division protein FtsB [Xanthomonas campestris pv. cannae]MDV0439186.1 cell division protein FtsB [Xanthomonas sacchari]PPU81700.1 cell division protein FtsB [Xanthomonas sacchari]
MRNWRWLLLVLAGLLAWLQYRFWLGPGNSGEVLVLESQVEHQKRDNEGLQQRNAALAAEVKDLKDGEAAIEERARSELGMIKPGEKFYRVVENAPVSTPAGTAAGAQPAPVTPAPGEQP